MLGFKKTNNRERLMRGLWTCTTKTSCEGVPRKCSHPVCFGRNQTVHVDEVGAWQLPLYVLLFVWMHAYLHTRVSLKEEATCVHTPSMNAYEPVYIPNANVHIHVFGTKLLMHPCRAGTRGKIQAASKCRKPPRHSAGQPPHR